MDAMAMKRQGLTIKEIADELGYHPSTISSWLKNGGPPPKRESVVSPAIDGRWAARIAELLRAAPRLLATSVFELIRAEGYERSYPSVSRHVHAIGGPRFHAAEAASTRIVTGPGQEGQFDWSDVSHWTKEWGLGDIQCFAAILCWSRVRIWWFARCIDREFTFEGLVRFFEYIGGVPHKMRTDRMGALGQSQRSQVQPASAGRHLRPAPRHRAGGLSGPGRQTQGQGGTPLPGREGSASWRSARRKVHRPAWLSSTSGLPSGSRNASTPGSTGAWARSPPTGSPSRWACSPRCPVGGSTRPMSMPVGSMWPSPRSSGGASATRCRLVASARCATKSTRPSSRSGGRARWWPPTPSPTR